MVSRWSMLLVIGSIALSENPLSAVCTITPCSVEKHCQSQSDSACLEQTCPETAWRVCLEDQGVKGLWLGTVDLRRTPQEPWIRILFEAGLTEIFVPYHKGVRLWDMRYCPDDLSSHDRCLRPVTPADAGVNGRLVTLAGDTIPRLVVEQRDRGIAWLCKWIAGQGGSSIRRGEEMLVWGVYDTGNYDFIIQYGFRDDGVITFRMGATGYNNDGEQVTPDEAHMHTALWRVDIDLNGASRDTAKLTAHLEPIISPELAFDFEAAFNEGLEGFLDWYPPAFVSLLVEDGATNAHGNHLGYELVPLATGVARHDGDNTEFSKHDFWVSAYHASEAGTSPPLDWRNNGELRPDSYLLQYVSTDGAGKPGPEPVVNNDIVLWHLSAAHHEPHDEDQAPNRPEYLDQGVTPGPMEGVTLVHWMGFDLVPHNFFDYNPLGGPHRKIHCNGSP